DEMVVKAVEVDSQGRLNLSRQAAIEELTGKGLPIEEHINPEVMAAALASPPAPREGGFGGRDRGGRNGGGRGRGPRRDVQARHVAVGAVLMMHMAEIAAPFFDGVEVIEMHHAAKLDAPSGTALNTARRLAAKRGTRPFSHKKAEKETLSGTRGGEEGGVGVHSVRLPGLVADQEVIFGLPGQTLTITHRTTSREAYVPGVLLAIRRVTSTPGFY